MQQQISVVVAAVVALVTVACSQPGDASGQASDAPEYTGSVLQVAPPPPPLPTGGNGSFAVGPGGGRVIGAGQKRIRYRVEVENGIAWGANIPWNTTDFAT